MIKSESLRRALYSAVLAGVIISDIDILAAESNGATRSGAYVVFEFKDARKGKTRINRSRKDLVLF